MYAKLGLNTKDQQGLMAYLMNVFNELELVLCAAKNSNHKTKDA